MAGPSDGKITYVNISQNTDGKIILPEKTRIDQICATNKSVLVRSFQKIIVYRIDEGTWENLAGENKDIGDFRQCIIDAEDNVLIRGEYGIWKWDGNVLSEIEFPENSDRDNILVQDKYRNWWLISGIGNVYNHDDEENGWREISNFKGMDITNWGLVTYFLISSDRELWLANDIGLYSWNLNPESEVELKLELKDNNLVTGVSEDNNGRIWITTIFDIYMIEDGAIKSISKPSLGNYLYDSLIHNNLFVLTDFGLFSISVDDIH